VNGIGKVLRITKGPALAPQIEKAKKTREPHQAREDNSATSMIADKSRLDARFTSYSATP
jgi:hypothetical protein